MPDVEGAGSGGGGEFGVEGDELKFGQDVRGALEAVEMTGIGGAEAVALIEGEEGGVVLDGEVEPSRIRAPESQFGVGFGTSPAAFNRTVGFDVKPAPGVVLGGGFLGQFSGG
jgi:hypothetical protein